MPKISYSKDTYTFLVSSWTTKILELVFNGFAIVSPNNECLRFKSTSIYVQMTKTL